MYYSLCLYDFFKKQRTVLSFSKFPRDVGAAGQTPHFENHRAGSLTPAPHTTYMAAACSDLYPADFQRCLLMVLRRSTW